MTEGVWRFLVTGGVILPVEVFGSGRGFVALGRFGGGPHKARGKNPRRAILTYARRWMRLTADQIEEIAGPGQRLRAEVEAEVQAALEERDRAYLRARRADGARRGRREDASLGAHGHRGSPLQRGRDGDGHRLR